MAGGNARPVGAVEFVQAAAARRAATYRERASQLAEMAEVEPISIIRGKLRALARRYEELAESTETALPG